MSVRRTSGSRVAEDDAVRVSRTLAHLFVDMENLLGWVFYKELPFLSTADRTLVRREIKESRRLDAHRIYIVDGMDIIRDEDYDILDGRIAVELWRVGSGTEVFWRTYEGVPFSTVIVERGSTRHIYEHPPLSVSSVLFFILNPRLQEQVSQLHGYGDERAEVWRYVFDSVMTQNPPSKTINVWSELDTMDLVTSNLNLAGHPKLSVFLYAGTGIPNIEDISTPYELAVRNSEEVSVYIAKGLESFSKLLGSLIPPDELWVVSREAETVACAVRRTPVAVSGILSLDDEWFAWSR